MSNCHTTTTVRKGKKVEAFSRSFKLEKVNGREWLRTSQTEKGPVKVHATVQVKTTSKSAVGQLAQRAAGRLFSIYCQNGAKKSGCSAAIEIREITQCVPNDRQKSYKYNASRRFIKEEDRGPFGQKYINEVRSQRAQSRRIPRKMSDLERLVGIKGGNRNNNTKKNRKSMKNRNNRRQRQNKKN
tara:strand:- start:403 stop:957 length:555 start_codon:yes stop_codon:yes gene_type:complete